MKVKNKKIEYAWMTLIVFTANVELEISQMFSFFFFLNLRFLNL